MGCHLDIICNHHRESTELSAQYSNSTSVGLLYPLARYIALGSHMA